MVSIRVHGDNIHTDNHQREVIGMQNINFSHMCVIYIVTHVFTSKLHQKKSIIYQKKSVFIRKKSFLTVQDSRGCDMVDFHKVLLSFVKYMSTV